MNIKSLQLLSIVGMVIMIGSLVNVLRFPMLILFAIGFGIFTGSIFKALKKPINLIQQTH